MMDPVQVITPPPRVRAPYGAPTPLAMVNTPSVSSVTGAPVSFPPSAAPRSVVNPVPGVLEERFPTRASSVDPGKPESPEADSEEVGVEGTDSQVLVSPEPERPGDSRPDATSPWGRGSLVVARVRPPERVPVRQLLLPRGQLLVTTPRRPTVLRGQVVLPPPSARSAPSRPGTVLIPRDPSPEPPVTPAGREVQES